MDTVSSEPPERTQASLTFAERSPCVLTRVKRLAGRVTAPFATSEMRRFPTSAICMSVSGREHISSWPGATSAGSSRRFEELTKQSHQTVGGDGDNGGEGRSRTAPHGVLLRYPQSASTWREDVRYGWRANGGELSHVEPAQGIDRPLWQALDGGATAEEPTGWATGSLAPKQPHRRSAN